MSLNHLNSLTSKYDVKKIEEVVYDISLRGLVKGDEGASGVGTEADDSKVQEVIRLLRGASS